MVSSPTRRGGLLGVLLLVLVLGLACGGDGHGPGVYEVRGVVEAVLADEGQLVVAHEDIEGLMPAMTMSFDVADPAILEGLAPGDAILFHLEAKEGRYRILDARVEGAAGAAGASGGSFEPAASAEPAPPFTLTDQSGAELSLADLRGKVVLLDFIYTHCPGPCPILTSTHVRVQRTLPEAVRGQVHFVSISIDPERDTPEALRAYAEGRGADLADWSFLTGPPEEVDPVLRAYGVGGTPGEGGEIVHVVATYLIDAQGHIARRYVGLEHHADDLRADVERAVAAAS
jgi:protein SCO1/2